MIYVRRGSELERVEVGQEDYVVIIGRVRGEVGQVQGRVSFGGLVEVGVQGDVR